MNPISLVIVLGAWLLRPQLQLDTLEPATTLPPPRPSPYSTLFAYTQHAAWDTFAIAWLRRILPPEHPDDTQHTDQ